MQDAARGGMAELLRSRLVDQAQSRVLWPGAMTVPATLCHTRLRENANTRRGAGAEIPCSRYRGDMDHAGLGGSRSRRSTLIGSNALALRYTTERSRIVCCS